jgi:hypothetical protein
MPDNSNTRRTPTSHSSKNIEIPSIPKQTAGAVAGAAVGSIAGPIGAVVGGVAGALAGRAAEKRGITAAATKTVAKVARNPKASLRQTPQRRRSRKSTGTQAKLHKGMGKTSSRSAGKRSEGRKKRH